MLPHHAELQLSAQINGSRKVVAQTLNAMPTAMLLDVDKTPVVRQLVPRLLNTSSITLL
jgi:hypothetical protein